jgi:hypothetical protein
MASSRVAEIRGFAMSALEAALNRDYPEVMASLEAERVEAQPQLSVEPPRQANTPQVNAQIYDLAAERARQAVDGAFYEAA